MGISKNTFVGRIVTLHRARNPHVPERTLRLLCALRLTLHPQKRIFRGAHKEISSVALRVLDDDTLHHIGDVFAAICHRLQQLVNRLHLDQLNGVTLGAEELRNGAAHHAIRV